MSSGVGRDSEDFENGAPTNQDGGDEYKKRVQSKQGSRQHSKMRRRPGRPRKSSRAKQGSSKRKSAPREQNRGADIGHPFFGNQWTSKSRAKQSRSQVQLNSGEQPKRPGRPKSSISKEAGSYRNFRD
jgi:hypothetical protein